MSTRLAIALVSAGSLLCAMIIGGGAAASISYANGIATYTASTSVPSIMGAVGILIAYSLGLNPEISDPTASQAGAGRRAVAWLIDFLLSIAALTSVLALIPLTVEALKTGDFVWQFERSQVTATDWLVTLVVVAFSFLGMAWYWTLPVIRSGQTIGQCIVGVKVVHAATAPSSVKRIWARGFLQPFGPLLWVGKLISGKYWQDEIANTRVVRVSTQVAAAA